MNKLKVLYELLKTMKSKEVVTGSLTAKVEKGQVKMFGLESEFEKNLVTGQTKSKVNVEMDYEGSTTGGEPGESPAVFCHPAGKGHSDHYHGFHRRGNLQAMFSRWAFGISLLQALQLEEKEGKKVVFTLNAKDLPADLQALFQEKMGHAAFRHPHNGVMKAFLSAASLDLVVTVLVNEQSEVEKIRVRAANEAGLTADGELSLQW